MSAVAGGSIVTLSVSGNVPAVGAPTWPSIQALIAQGINNSGWLTVLAGTSYQTPSAMALLESLDFLGYPYTGTIVVQLAASADGTDSTDIAYEVSSNVAAAVGQAPNGVSVVSIGNVATGQGAAAPPAASTIAGWFSSLGAGFQSLGTTAIVGIVVLLIALLYILAPHAGTIAKAALA